MKNHRRRFALTLAMLLSVSALHAQDLTGYCLDLGEGGCTGQYLPFDGMSIGFCEETCTLNNPVPVTGLDAMLYDMECVSDNPENASGRVMILRQITPLSRSPRTLMIDASQIRPIVVCP